MPTHARSNMASPGPPVSFIHSPFTTTLVLVPISVQTPPKVAANAMGMYSCDAATRDRLLNSSTTGRNIATTGVLFRKALNPTTGASSRNCAARGVRGAPISPPAIRCIARV